MCLASFFVLVHQFLWNSGSRTHGPGKVLKLAQLQVFYSHAVMLHHFCGFGMLLTSSTSGPLQAESETLLPSWLRCLHMVDKKTILLRCCMLQCCLCLLIMSLPIQLQEKIHHNWSQVPPTSSNNGTQLSHPLPGSSWKRKTDKPWKKVCGKVQLPLHPFFSTLLNYHIHTTIILP